MKILIDFFRLIRFPNLIIIFLTQYAIRFGIIYPFLSQVDLGLFMSEKLFLLLAIATVLIAAAGYIINDYFDVKLDHLNKPKQLIVGKLISRRIAMTLHVVLNLIGILMAAYVAVSIGHPMLLLFQVVSAALLWYYSVSFKKQVLIGNIIIALLTALVPFTAGYYEMAVMFDFSDHWQQLLIKDTPSDLKSFLFSIKYLIYWIIGYSAFAFLLTLVREIIKDMEDIEGDKAFDCKTMPIIYGIPTSKKVANGVALFLLALILALLVVQFFSRDWISFTYFLVLIFIPIAIVIYRIATANKKRDFFLASQFIKIIMLFGILYTGLIYLY